MTASSVALAARPVQDDEERGGHTDALSGLGFSEDEIIDFKIDSSDR